jgi:hypothetical protein
MSRRGLPANYESDRVRFDGGLKGPPAGTIAWPTGQPMLAMNGPCEKSQPRTALSQTARMLVSCSLNYMRLTLGSERVEPLTGSHESG